MCFAFLVIGTGYSTQVGHSFFGLQDYTPRLTRLWYSWECAIHILQLYRVRS